MTDLPDYDIPEQTEGAIDGLTDITEPEAPEPEPAPKPVKPSRRTPKTKPTKTVYKPFHW